MPEQAVDAHLLLLIEKLSSYSLISDFFYLAGGTALAFYLEHRVSEDIDLFSRNTFEVEKYLYLLQTMSGKLLIAEEGTIHCIIEGIKVSLLFYPYQLLFPQKQIRGLNIVSFEDIACMKAVALSQRGEKKDFFDMFEILKIIKPAELKNMLLKKYGQERVNCYHILKSFFYFDDAEDSPDPLSLKSVAWPEVKQFFIDHEADLTKGFLF